MILIIFRAIIPLLTLLCLSMVSCTLSDIGNMGDGSILSITSMLGNNGMDVSMIPSDDDAVVILGRNGDSERINPRRTAGRRCKSEGSTMTSGRASSLLRSSVCMPYSTPSSMRHLILWTDPFINLLQSDLQELSKHTLDAVLDAMQSLLIVLRQSWIEFIMRTSKGMHSGRFSLKPLFGTEESFKQCLDGWLKGAYMKLFGEERHHTGCHCKDCKPQNKNKKDSKCPHNSSPNDMNDGVHEISIEHTERIFKVFRIETIKHLFDSYQKVFVQFYKESIGSGDSGLHPLYMLFKWMSMSTGAETGFDRYLYGTDSDGIFKNMTKWKSSDVKNLILALPVLREQWIELAFYLREQNVARCKLNLGLIKEKLSTLKLDADLVVDDDLCYF